MKELSIEQKAHYYDEAIKVANKYKDTHIMFSQIKDEIFPELKESEDEKIRKEILVFMNKLDEQGYTDSRYPSWVAWLEKQGETFTKKDIDDAYLKGVCNTKQELEKQGEQKIIEWSEEDKTIMSDTLSNLIELEDRYGEGYGNVGKCIDWLKSLKDRALPQSKKEWSDVDKDILFRIIDDLKFLDSVNIIDVEREINWLKSLSPQNTWKPSDAQMASITCAVRKMKESACYDSELVSLLNDLKNLK